MSVHVPRAVEGLVPPPSRSGSDLPALDALRALGALCVLTTHVAFWSGDYTRNGAVGTFLSRLDVGVAIFFVLSGFLLARPWLAGAADGTAGPGTRAYLWRRLLRVYPLYAVTAVLALTFVERNGDLAWAERLRTMLMLNTFTDVSLPAGLTHMWSLAVEVTFYLLLPLLMTVLIGRRGGLAPRRVVAGLGAMALVSVWWHLDGAGRAGDLAGGSPYQWLPAYLTWFGVGIALALVHVLHERRRPIAATASLMRLARQPGVCWTLVAGLMLVASTPVAGPSLFASPSPTESLVKNVLYAVVGLLVVITGLFAAPGSRYAAVLSHPVARRLGWISFGVFCLHLPLLHLIMWATPLTLFDGDVVVLWLLTTSVSLIAAELAYRLVERPAMRLRHLVPDGRRTPDVAPSSTTPSDPTIA